MASIINQVEHLDDTQRENETTEFHIEFTERFTERNYETFADGSLYLSKEEIHELFTKVGKLLGVIR